MKTAGQGRKKPAWPTRIQAVQLAEEHAHALRAVADRLRLETIGAIDNTAARNAAMARFAARKGITHWVKDTPDLVSSPFTPEFNDLLERIDREAEHGLRLIQAVNNQQRSQTSWQPTATTCPTLPCWTSRNRWLVTCACFFATPAGDRCRSDGTRIRIGRSSLLIIARTLADFADSATGRNCCAANTTIAKAASRQAGRTMSPDTITRAVAALIKAGLLHEAVRGRYLSAAERLAARVHHGARQIRCASTRHLTMNKTLTQASGNPDLPRRGHSFREILKKVGGYSHARTCARGRTRPKQTQTTKKHHPRHPDKPPIPLWAWRLTDQLVRIEPDEHGQRGPMASWLPIRHDHPSGIPTRAHRGTIARTVARYATPETTATDIVEHMDHYRKTHHWEATIPTRPAAYLAHVLTQLTAHPAA